MDKLWNVEKVAANEVITNLLYETIETKPQEQQEQVQKNQVVRQSLRI